MSYPQAAVRCSECARLMAQRRERERLYLTALGNLTAAAGINGAEYMNLRTLVHDAEIELKIVGAEISQHQDRHAIPN